MRSERKKIRINTPQRTPEKYSYCYAANAQLTLRTKSENRSDRRVSRVCCVTCVALRALRWLETLL